MNVVTLTSDLGTRDYYLAALKAALIQQLPGVMTVDISHHIPAFDMFKAAFVLRNVWRDFPSGTVHIIGVDCDWRQDTPYIWLEKEGHIFIGADTGIFSLIFDGEPADRIFSLNMRGDEDLSFPAKNIFIPLAARLINGEDWQVFGTEREGYRRRQGLNPVVEPTTIRGTVIYVDAYGNVITNITRELFEQVVGHRPFGIVVRRGGDSELNSISRTYNEVGEGEMVALFTSGDFLEIAINRGVEGSGGGAADLLGIRENDIIRVEFD